MRKIRFIRSIKLLLLLIAFSLLNFTSHCFSQGAAINTTGAASDPSAMLDVSSNNAGMLMPRMTTAERNAIVNPAVGLQIYNTTNNCFEFFAFGVWQELHCAVCPMPDDAGIINGNNSVCQGDNNVSYSVPIIANANNYIWSFSGSGATITGNSNNVTIDFSALATSGDLTVKGNNMCGDGTISNNYPIVVNPSLPVSVNILASTNPICSGESVVFTATPTNEGTSPNYQWKVNGINVGTNSNTFNSSTLNDGDEVSCELTSSLSCTSGSPALSNIITMTVNPNLPVSISIAESANPICLGANVTFTATTVNGGLAPSYQWKINGLNAGTNSPTFISNSLSDGDQVICELTSSLSCITGSPATSNLLTMLVNPNLTVGVNIIASSNPVCDGENVTFTATPTNGGTSPSYQWKINGSNVGINSNVFNTNTLANGDEVTCELLSNETCVTGNPATSNIITMTVNSYLPVSVSITPSANPVNSGVNVTFTATPTNGGSSPAYQWSLNGLNVGTNSNTYSNSSLSNGDKITCKLTSNENCVTNNPATSDTITMAVNPAPAHVIGDFYEGGYIFYLDANSCGGLVCDPNDLGMSSWGCEEYIGTSTAFGTGMSNTKNMVDYAIANQGNMYVMCPGYASAEMCYYSTESGYDDWFLPSKDELVLMATNLSSLGVGNLYGEYWSSSEMHDFESYYVDINTATDYTTYKFDNKNVRAVRWFNPPPIPDNHITDLTEIQWNWNIGSSVANSFKYNTTPDYATAIDIGTNNSFTQTGLTCGTYYNLYVWAVYDCGASDYTVMTAQTTPIPIKPATGFHDLSLNSIVWNWNASAGAAGYMYNTVNDYSTAIDNGASTSLSQIGFACNTPHTLYVWAYNDCGVSAVTTLNASTLCCDVGNSVTFNYSGSSVTYYIAGGQNGSCWLDRNLGASTVATALDHTDAYGDLFQWGRLDDGHQKRNSSATTVLSSTDVPGHNKFINTTSNDWRTTKNNLLWQGVSGINNPCPTGWRLPTKTEFEAEYNCWNWDQNDQFGTSATEAAYNSTLKWTSAGWRTENGIYHLGYAGHYWGSTIQSNNPITLYFHPTYAFSPTWTARDDGRSVRCIRD